VIRILAIGDSYTVGEGVPEEGSWPRLLEQSPGPTPIRVTVVARTGWTAREAHQAVRTADPEGPFDAAMVQVGVNDQYRGGTPEDYGRDLAALLLDAIDRVGGDPARLVFVSIPDWSVTPFAEGHPRAEVASAIDAHNEAAAAAVTEIGGVFVDVTAISRRAAGDPGLVAADGLHPSTEMYRRWLVPIRRALNMLPSDP
jgi:lysophospholipase L1-like esterase